MLVACDLCRVRGGSLRAYPPKPAMLSCSNIARNLPHRRRNLMCGKDWKFYNTCVPIRMQGKKCNSWSSDSCIGPWFFHLNRVTMQSDDASEAQDAFPFVEGYLLELTAQGSKVVPLRGPGWRGYVDVVPLQACLQCLHKHTHTRKPTTPTRMEFECM